MEHLNSGGLGPHSRGSGGAGAGGHLSHECLARLVDEGPSPEERAHLNRCRRCRDELDAFQVQTIGLSHLPDLRPPRGDWKALESRLRAEGLIRNSGAGERADSRSTPRSPGRRGAWRGGRGAGQAAAAVLLLVLGAAGGAGIALASGAGAWGGAEGGPTMTSNTGPGWDGTGAVEAVPVALGLTGRGGPATLEEAEEVVRLTEAWYRSALLRYREAAGVDAQPLPFEGGFDSRSRVAALESLLAAGQAALRDAPTDPFLNGLLVNMQAERDVRLQGIRNAALTQEDGWF